MRANWDKSLALVLQHEGGYVNHPDDPGGATNKGITQRVYDAFRDRKSLPRQSVRNITSAEVSQIYREQYWNAVRGDELPAGVDYAVFDYAVNSGAKRSKEELQRVLGVGVDGQLGGVSMQALHEACMVDEEAVIKKLCDRRMRFVRSLKTFKTFGKGWTRRIVGERDGFQITDHGVIDLAIMMARDDLAYPLPSVRAAEGKALETDVKQSTTPTGVGAVLSGAGITGQTVVAAAEQVKPHVSETPFGMIAMGLFLLLMVSGVGLMVWTSYQKVREQRAA
jgi:lysozyme family protein